MNNYFEKPNLPDRPVKCVIVDRRADGETVETLEQLGIDVIPSAKTAGAYEAVKTHPDITICHIGGARFVVSPDTYEYYKSVLPGAEIIKGSSDIGGKYPYDVPYNCAAIGGRLICSVKYAAAEIKNAFENIIDIKQGYAKCSICAVAENAVITADKGAAEKCRAAGMDVLEITPGHIELTGMDSGFIGGSCGLIARGVLAVNGELCTHPDGERIKAFCERHGVSVGELKSGAICDIGSILPVF